MSLMSGMANFFGLSRKPEIQKIQKAQIREEINLMEAINAHIKWKIRLQDYLDGTSKEQLDPTVICRDDQCALGKWIHGPALKHFSEDATFAQLRVDHAQFHMVAGNVVSNMQSNKRNLAEELMDGEYRHASHKVIQALTELNQQVNG